MKILSVLTPFSQRQIAFGGAGLIFLIGIVDFLSGPQFSVTIFYIFPIAICAWHCQRKVSISYAFLAAIVWLVSDKFSSPVYSHFLVPYWNSTTRIFTYLIIVYLLSGYREQLAVEENLADTDSLTGALNHRAFKEKVVYEIERLRRFQRPFSVAYIDLDNFKFVNDTMGHAVGDLLLKKVIEVMKSNTRVIDTVARIGGDEFAVILTDTGQVASCEAIEKLRSLLLSAMQASNWPVTFSIGIVTCEDVPDSMEQIVNFADGLMYSVKKSGKNRIAHALLK